jgi:PPOX class probable F420-dependent enzyme
MNLSDVDPEILANTSGVLCTLDSAGRPQLTAVWFIVRNGHLWVSINANRQKARNVATNAECSMLIFHPQTDNYFAEVRGTATLIADPEYTLSDEIAARYNADFRAFDQPGDTRFVIDITPSKVLITDVRH